MADPNASLSTGMTGPTRQLLNVTPSDTVDVATVGRAITVLVSGTVRITAANNADGTYSDFHIAAGTPLPVCAKRIWDTGTTATGIVSLI